MTLVFKHLGLQYECCVVPSEQEATVYIQTCKKKKIVTLFSVTESSLYRMKRVFELQICNHFHCYLLQQLFARV